LNQLTLDSLLACAQGSEHCLAILICDVGKYHDNFENIKISKISKYCDIFDIFDILTTYQKYHDIFDIFHKMKISNNLYYNNE